MTPRLEVGAPIEVHSDFNDTWVTGFEIAAVFDDGYRVRRTHDRSLLPNRTGDDDVRPAPAPQTWS